MMKKKNNPAEKTSQFNIRIPAWLLEDLTAIALRQSRTVSDVARRLLKDADHALRGECICHRATPGRGPSGMPCAEHGDPMVAFREWHVT